MIFLNSIAFILLLFLLLLLSMVWPPDSPWAPWWKIKKTQALSIIKRLPITKQDTVYELGSGDGEFILTVVRMVNVRKAVGIEIDPLRYLQSKVRRFMQKATNATFIRENFFNVSLVDATVIFVYLVPRALERLLPKLESELKKGTIIISYRYKIPLKKTNSISLYDTDTKNEIYYYKTV